VTVSLPSSTKKTAGSYRKPQPDLYTLLLVIALLAIIAAVVFLYLHLQSYNFEMKGGPPVAELAAAIRDWLWSWSA
jgi:hypothetical protein